MRLGINPALAGLKSLNRLETVLARAEWSDEQVPECLMQDAEGLVVCGTMSNVFMRFGKQWVTPLLDRCGVAGVMRQWALESAAAFERSVQQRYIAAAELAQVDELFLTNALVGIWPVAELHLPEATRVLEVREARDWQTRLEQL
jgi:4-amino-4-deoxychorismate lyase